MLSRRFPFTRLRFSFVAALVAIAMWLSAPGGVAEAAGSWTNVIGLPMQTVNHCAAVLNDKLYVLGGGTIPNSYSSTNAFRLDGTNWTSIPWAPVGGFGGLISAGAATLNGTLYLIGGHNGSSERTNVYSFNGTNWTVAPSLPAARQYLAACTFQSKIYAIGGRFGVSAQTNVYCFDGTNWSETVGLPVVNMALSASVHNGRLYAVGGYDGVTPSYTNVYRFDGTNWTAVAGLPVPRSHHSTAEMGGRLYAMGGVYGTVHSNVYCYDGTNWTESPGLPLAKGYLAAAATLGNKIYHTGGSTDMANGVTNVFAWVDPSVKLDQLITFVPVPPQKVSGSVGLAATASSGLPVGFAVGSGPASITGGTNLSFTGVGTVSIVVSQSGDATYNPAPNVTNTFHVYALSAYSGPFAGGNTITITNGNFGTITNVLVGGVASTIEASGANWVRITVPAAGSAGAKDLVIQTSDNGDKTLAAAYTVNPAGDISGGTGSRMWQSVGQALVPGQVSAVGANNTIYGMDYYGNNLYIGGAFTNAGGSNCYRVARHDGTNWHSMQAGVLRVANVNCIKGSPHGIYSGGYFTNIGGSYNPDGTMNNDGGVNAYAAARFDGTSWNAMGHAPLLGNKTGLYFTVSINGYVNWMEPYKDDTVIAVGYFTNSDYRAAGLNYIAKYDGAGWTNMQGGFRNVPLAAAYDRDRDHLYVGGSFTNHYPTNTSRHIRYIARWDGVNWTNMAQGFGNRVTCMAVNPANGELYIGGWFTNYFDSAGDPHPANYVAKWDPVSQSLTNVGSGFNNWVYALKVAPDGTLYAGGSFTNTYISTEPDKSAPQLAVRRIAMWNGTHWTNMGRGLSDTVLSLTVNTNNNDVYAGGYFRIATQDDGTDTNTWHIASYGAGGVTSTGVDPDTGPITGGFEVVISGSNLGSGDITNVTLCGVSVASIVSQSATQVVVVAAAGDPGMGDVRVYSASYGETVKSDAFTYTGPLFALLGANGAAVASGEAVSEAKGTDFGTINLGDAATNRFAITNAGDAVLTISSWPTNGTGAGAFAIAGMPVTVAAGTISNFSVIFTPVSAGTSTCTVSIVNSSTNTPYLLNLSGHGVKQNQTITFPAIPDQLTTNLVGLAATASSGLAVQFSVGGGSALITGDTNLSFTGTGSVLIVASQIGDANWNPAPNVTNTFNVTKAAAGVYLQDLAQTYDGTARSVTATSDPSGLTIEFTYNGNAWAPTNAGSYAITGVVNDVMYQGSQTGTLVISKGAASVYLLDLAQTYDGTAKSVTATSDPAGLTIEFTYNGNAWAPTNAGSYAVTGTVNDVNWVGSADGTLVVSKGTAGVYLLNLAQTYDGLAKSVTATSDPSGLTIEFTYNGNAWAPTNAGSYAVTGTVNDANWQGSADSTLVVSKGAAEVYLLDLAQTYDGTARSVAATSDPSGLTIEFTYNGNAWAPTNTGSYAVTGTVNDANWQGTADGTLVVSKGAANVYLLDLTQTYDGTAKSASATTMPAGLTVEFTYNGSSTSPSEAGSYAVTGTVNDANWQGEETGTLTIGKAGQTITFSPVAPQKASAIVGLAATGGGSGNPVTFAAGAPGVITDGTNLSYTGVGDVIVVASQAGNADYEAAPDVTNVVKVFSVTPDVGPFAGGHNATISNGYFGTITNVLVGGVAAAIQSSGANWVTLTVPAVGSHGIKDIVIQTSDNGETTLPDAYTVAVRAEDLPLGSLVYDDDWTWSGLPLKWRVVDTNYGGTAGLVTLQATSSLGGRAYHEGAWANQWGSCTLRTWLNSTNFHGGFSPAFSGAVVCTRVPWTTYNSAGAFVSGITTDQVFIASRTELGGDVWASEGEVLDWFSDPGTAAARRSDLSPSPMNYWTRSGMRAMWGVTYYDLAAYYAAVPGGAIAYGPWTGDALGVVPMVNIGGPVEFAVQPDGTYRLYEGPLPQSITFPNPGPQFTTNVVALSATASSGQDVIYSVLSGPASVAGGILTFTGTGDVTVIASHPGNAYWNPAPNLTNAFTVTKATASLALTNLNQIYSGSAREAGYETVPAGLTVLLTYDGNLWAPTNAGSYAVAGVVDDVMWQGSQTGTLTVAKADQTIAFPPIADQLTTNEVGLAATAASGFDVTFFAGAPPAVIMGGTNLSFTGTGMVSVVASQAGDANWNPAPDVTNTFTVTKAAASLTLTNLNQACDGTARTAGYAVVPSGLTVLLTYNGNVWAPTNVGSYAVTGVVDDVMWQGLATGTLVVVKGDQIITNFLPADGAVFVLGTATSVSAQASSGLAVGFNNLTPEIASLTGTAIAFTNPGAARVQAFQPGDANWNAAVPVVHEWRVGGLITNIMPGAANVGGGIEVLIQGLWLGDGSNITTVELAGVAADIVTQGVHEVTVTAGAAPAAVTGDVFVVSGTGGEMWMSNAFEYLWFDAPVQLDPVDITASNLVARWLLAAGADKHILEVGLDTNFTAHLPGYEAVDVALAQQYLVAGLTEGTWYAMRLFAWNTNGYSPPSRTVWVPAGTNLPYVTHPPMGGPVTEDAVMQFTLACMFHGSGLIYTAESSDTNIVGVSIAGGVLEIDPRNPGTATITVTATDPATGYSASYSFVIEVVGTVPFSSAFQDREIWNPRFTQRLWVTNDLAIDAIGIRVLFAGLLPGIIVENQTGISVDGRPMIEMEAPFPPDGTMELDIIYICTGAETVSDYPPVVEVQYILPGWRPPLPGEGVPVGVKLVFDAERVLLEFDTTVGMLYAIEYMNNFPAGTWREVSLRLRATANRTQWIDAGPPATLPFEGLRVYRIKAVAE